MICPNCDQLLAEVRELRSDLEAQRVVTQYVAAEMRRFKRLCEMKDRMICMADAMLADR